uniref:Uncharacterized protein n=1 Tax=Chromera velia CCMP2878 TaxID=1169474 RepID=A0A0G4HXB6_9ALVE|eukprot:Cvel_33085.t1-p1 / transcript=Cvel_33085.t1 / gene=Cvel_33085 / organism=Chromera_velia_CCMP2878 / gene_product=hypothetical protein / transcript_product=hypothetical protein / location=Cvel_scaffold5281:1247-2104(+) / protein_length=143 / sequence_SO=supercontig / SO=protein_coding / is_pseudo=false
MFHTNWAFVLWPMALVLVALPALGGALLKANEKFASKFLKNINTDHEVVVTSVFGAGVVLTIFFACCFIILVFQAFNRTKKELLKLAESLNSILADRGWKAEAGAIFSHGTQVPPEGCGMFGRFTWAWFWIDVSPLSSYGTVP